MLDDTCDYRVSEGENVTSVLNGLSKELVLLRKTE